MQYTNHIVSRSKVVQIMTYVIVLLDMCMCIRAPLSMNIVALISSISNCIYFLTYPV